jgi:hypothetical protein
MALGPFIILFFVHFSPIFLLKKKKKKRKEKKKENAAGWQSFFFFLSFPSSFSSFFPLQNPPSKS